MTRPCEATKRDNSFRTVRRRFCDGRAPFISLLATVTQKRWRWLRTNVDDVPVPNPHLLPFLLVPAKLSNAIARELDCKNVIGLGVAELFDGATTEAWENCSSFITGGM